MAMYMYPIIIKREPQTIRYSREFEVGESITLAKLRKYNISEDEIFSMYQTDEGLHSKNMLTIQGKRLETKEEVALRVEKEERYMKNYTEFHNKKKQSSLKP